MPAPSFAMQPIPWMSNPLTMTSPYANMYDSQYKGDPLSIYNSLINPGSSDYAKSIFENIGQNPTLGAFSPSTSQAGINALTTSPFFDQLQNMGKDFFSYAPDILPALGLAQGTAAGQDWAGKNYFDFSGKTTPAFTDLINTIQGADKSVLDPLLADVDRATAANVGSVQSDFQERGLGGPGQISSMEESALTGAREGGDIAKSDITSQFLMGKQGKLEGAYGGAYDAATKGAMQGAGLYDQLLGQKNRAMTEGPQNLLSGFIGGAGSAPGLYNQLLQGSNQNVSNLADMLMKMWMKNQSQWANQTLQDTQYHQPWWQSMIPGLAQMGAGAGAGAAIGAGTPGVGAGVGALFGL